MFSRRKFRETLVQLLFARGNTPQQLDAEAFWELTQEPALKAFDKARLKVHLHLQQARPRLLEALEKLLSEARGILSVADQSGKLPKQVESLLTAEQAFLNQAEALRRLAKTDSGDWRNEFQNHLQQAQVLPTLRKPLEEAVPAFPPHFEEKLEGVLKQFSDLDLRTRRVSNPSAHPEIPELTHLRKTQHELETFRAQVTKRADLVQAAYPQIDPILGQTSTNFSFDRFTRVDRIILRCAVWELLNDLEIPHPVVITEAVEIARRFGATKSTSFVNGLLDAIAKGPLVSSE